MVNSEERMVKGFHNSLLSIPNSLMTEEIEQILRAAEQVTEAAEVYSTVSTVTSVSFAANRCHSVETRLARGGLGLRVIRDRRLGFSSVTNLEQVDDLVEAACETARFGEPAGFRFPARGEFPPSPAIESNRITLLLPGPDAEDRERYHPVM